MRTARRVLFLGVALAAPSVAVGLLFPGAFARKLIESGFVTIVPVLAVAAWLWRRGEKADREQDEREEAIISASTRFAFFTMAIVIQGYYAWRFAAVGPDEPSFWLVAALWGSFMIAYIYNRVRT